MDKLYIVMPVYNEESIIAKVIDEWHSVVEFVGNGSKLVIFNDGSKDNTLSILEKIKNKYANLIIISKENAGHGPTCIAAYKYAVAEKADWIFQTDSDGQTKLKDFWPFWEKRNKFDFIMGRRVKRGDGFIKWLISRTLKLLVFMIFGIIMKDVNSPFRLMKSERLCRYLPMIPDNYFLPNTLLSVMITKNNEKILWQNISFSPRTHGISSMPLKKVIGLGMFMINQLYKMKNIRLPR
ncbi:MAG: glycosyltransferase family 2 protein [Syntrophaceae bacterium]|nr:glycosyltransferase family 2 protein [Syntrophaceae bacterium]